MSNLLTITNLGKKFSLKRSMLGFKSNFFWAVNNVSFQIEQGESLGLVGESGSGKSTVARLVMQLLHANTGSVLFQGQEITKLSSKKKRAIFQKMQMIFQDPLDALDGRWTIAESVGEPVRIIEKLKKKEAQERVDEVLSIVNFPLDRKKAYPHQLSGGQRQRALIARALILNPKLIIADEPVSSLDVSMQAQILNEMKLLEKKFNITYFFISHDLHVVRFICSQIMVMYYGYLLEMGRTEEIYTNPLHPYTQELHNSILVPTYTKSRQEQISVTKDIVGTHRKQQACCFVQRCPKAFEPCYIKKPILTFSKKENRQIACHLYVDYV